MMLGRTIRQDEPARPRKRRAAVPLSLKADRYLRASLCFIGSQAPFWALLATDC